MKCSDLCTNPFMHNEVLKDVSQVDLYINEKENIFNSNKFIQNDPFFRILHGFAASAYLFFLHFSPFVFFLTWLVESDIFDLFSIRMAHRQHSKIVRNGTAPIRYHFANVVEINRKRAKERSIIEMMKKKEFP